MGEKLANGRVDLELLRFPLVTLTERAKLSDEERREFLEALDVLVDRRGRHGIILDLRLAQPLPDGQRASITEHFRARSEAIAEKWVALAVIVRPPLLDNLPTGAFWVRVSPVPTKVFTTVEEAESWMSASLVRRASREMVVADESRDSDASKLRSR